MPVLSSELVAYASASMPEDDTSSNGGAIDDLTRVTFTDLASNAALEALSDNAGDTMNLTLRGRDAGGEIQSETAALTGTSVVSFSTLGTLERFLSGLLASAPAGNVTIRVAGGGATIAVIPAGETGVRRLFIEAFSVVGSAKTYYEKIFLKNNNATLSLTNAAVVESADPGANINFLLAAAVDDSATSTNRLTVPNAADTLDPDTFGDASVGVPGGSLAADEAIGVWVRMSLTDGQSPAKNTWSVQLSGTST